MKKYKTPSRGAQSGLTLIELMVAIAISLFMLAAMIGIYLNMKTSFSVQEKMSDLQDGERLVLTMMTNAVQSAGYFPDPLGDTANSALPATTGQWADGTSFTLDAGEALVGDGDGSGSGDHSDKVAVQYQSASGDGLMNCQGQTNSSGSNSIWVNIFSVNSNNELICKIDKGDAVVLASNVAKMSILYGIKATPADGQSPDATTKIFTYLPAKAVASAGLWGSVKTVKISITFVDTISPAGDFLPTLVQTINLKNRT